MKSPIQPVFDSILAEQASAFANLGTITRRVGNGAVPLSFSQQRLWFLNQLEPENFLYNIAKALRLRGVLHIEGIHKALDAIVERHEILRTNISALKGDPVQVVAKPRSVQLKFVDLSERREETRETEMHELLRAEAQRAFDLSSDLMLRAMLVRLAENDHMLLLVIHHIASDGWSMAILLQEFGVFYGAFCARRPSPLLDLPIQYADFALWQRQRLRGSILETQLSYWKKQLSRISLLDLPTDKPRPATQSFRGARHFLVLPRELTYEVKALSRKERVTPFMTILAGFQTLLHRYTGQEDIAVGSAIANRTMPEVERLIGFFVNTLVLKTDLSGNPKCNELLTRVREVTLDAYENQELPFEKLVEELHPDRNRSHSPLFQVALVYQNTPGFPISLPGLTVTLVDIDIGTAKFDLTFEVIDKEEGLECCFEYNTDLFNCATVHRMAGHFQTLLEEIVANPEQRVSELPLLTESERHQLLVEWNDTNREYPNDKCVHQLFEAQVEKTPDAIAVVFEDQQLTYRELNHRANQLAHYMRKLGVGPEVLVGICVERSIEMIVGLLGVLKTGGAYLPLDPDYPKERLAFMLEDAQARVLLTQARLYNNLPDNRAHVVCLDRDGLEIAQESTENPNTLVPAESLAYVIYTSGSTGKPKGVAVEHRQLINYLSSIIERLDLTAQRSLATVSTLAADLGNTVIFSSLCSGAALHVISRDRIADAEAMADYFSRYPIDCLKIVPSHLAALQSVPRPERVLPRQLLILGGEASDIDWIKRLATLAPDCRIVNHYGPTETTVGVTTYAVEKDALPLGLAHLPLGRPLANTQIYILDQNLNPVPIGVAGEIYIGGVGLARDYLNRPELTVERFTANPFSAEPGVRLYKTGDRARYLADGNIEFLGRIGNQIKLRGYRIEPGEIEAALKQHPDVREAIVLERSGTNGEKQLAAYLVVALDRAPLIAGKPRYRLPNGAAVTQLNKNETDYIYQEIFERQAYLRHGITIHDGDCIFDVGANIGLFTLFANQIARHPKVYSFEPNPAVFEILKVNAKLTGSDVRLFDCGLADRTGDTTFTFFPGFSLLSGFYADAQAEKQVVKTFILNQQKAGVTDMTQLAEQADAILAERFNPQRFTAELRTLSSIIEQDEIESIDLLKINVEKSELDVLNGIKDQDWPKIKQIVLEVDVKEHLPAITSLLVRHGYEYVVEQDHLLTGTSLCYVYAIRPSEKSRLIREQPAVPQVRVLPVVDRPLISASEIKAYLATKLPEYMIPSAFVFLDNLPLTPNGKVDRQSLLVLGNDQANHQKTFEAPRTPVEELLEQIWAEVLKLDKVGIHDNFFDLGGHSLLATQLISRVRDALKLDLPLRSLFEAPTIYGLAQRVQGLKEKQDVLRGTKITPVARERYRVQQAK